jgi:hypothetical protein
MHVVYVSQPRTSRVSFPCSSMNTRISKVFSTVNMLTSLLLEVRAHSLLKNGLLIRIFHLSTHITPCSKSTLLETPLHVRTNSHLKTLPPMYSFQVIILAILATRMHLHLWHSERRIHDSALSVIPLSDVSFAGHTTTTSTA